MKDSFLFRIHPLLAAAIVVGGFFAILFGAYGLTRLVSQGEVMGRVEVSGTSLGGSTEDQALSTMVAVEDSHLARTVTFSVDERPVHVQPPEAGFDVHEEDIVDEAMAVGREGNAAYQFIFWLTNIFETHQVEMQGSIDPDSVDVIFDTWDQEVIGMPASLGGLELEEGELSPVYPQAGLGVSRDEAADILLESMLATNPSNHPIPTESIIPLLSDEEVDEAFAEANQMLSGPVTMVYNGSQVVFTTDQLASAFVSETIAESAPRIRNWFDPIVIDSYLDPVRSEFEAEPVNARFEISGDSIDVIPGKQGTRIDEEEVAIKLYQASLTESRAGQLTLVEDAEPDTTTEELEDLNINHLVVSFTTYHPCCADRVTNIQTMADAVDGAIVRSGQTFSINDYVGQRTPEKGYVPAGTIVAGELQDTVGGGVSQFATTIYNAVFWGGYEDVQHKPHSYYFSRYPEGIEATVNWTSPDLVFRNNRSGALMIDTRYSAESITVRIFGDNDGRTLKGEQSGGESRVWVAAGGGSDALHVKGEVSDRFGQTSPGDPKYRANPELGVDQVVQTQSERDGWSVTVKRRILRNGETLVEEQEWTVRYSPQFAVIEVHPCKVPGNEGSCPTTTTSTLPPTTTVPPTTIPPPPTTTTTSGE